VQSLLILKIFKHVQGGRFFVDTVSFNCCFEAGVTVSAVYSFSHIAT